LQALNLLAELGLFSLFLSQHFMNISHAVRLLTYSRLQR
jgi:hypothetical protein